MNFNYYIVFLVLVLTVLVVLIFFNRINSTIAKMSLVLSLLSIYIYSGYGIGLHDVPNKYIYKYVISIICFCYPFYRLFKKRVVLSSGWFDSLVENNIIIVKRVSVFYILLLLFPCIYPSFKLFDVLVHGISISDIYDQYNASMGSALLRLIDAVKTFILPFFYAYLLYLSSHKATHTKSIILLVVSMYLEIARYSYIGRYQIVVDFLKLFLFAFCFNGCQFSIRKKQLIIISSIAVASIPFMYAYIAIRDGNIVESLSFGQSLELLLESEVNYPQYYEHIVSSSVLKNESAVDFVLWLICLPIPSVIWPSKPSLQSDLFTFSITGLNRVDYGYSSLLPSYLGQCMIYFGEHFYWVFALLVGYVFASVLLFVSKSKYLQYYAVYLSLMLLTVGRAGPTSALPVFINGSLLLFLLYFFQGKTHIS